MAFPGRFPSRFAAGHKWATSKKQSDRPHWKRRQEQALLAETVSPAVQRLDRSRQEVRDEVSELKLELEQQKCSLACWMASVRGGSEFESRSRLAACGF
jgi:hypothetical protein